ncbi:hypothetical protein GIB67_000571 [Kingdonia uniflora]|uniref:ATPase AAA-type core domain-containing protein n=1 Tax=Kingdonia uniflora TaxID=39325 RepID=A0A7J7MIJ6_9MAGN|nr:hypothetical protein GIB67_000571 [Kingdonia uniflora]
MTIEAKVGMSKSYMSPGDGSRRRRNILTHEEQEAVGLKYNAKKCKNYNMTQLSKTPMFIEAREVESIPIRDNLSTYSSLSVTGRTNKEQCIDQNASVLLGTSCGINDTLNKGNAQFVLIMDTTLSDTGEPTIANDVFESLRYAANIDAPVAITATSTGEVSTTSTVMVLVISVSHLLISLDMGALIAGAKFCGEFEDRLKVVLKEVTDLEEQIILFIDEIHTVVGAGATNGAMDVTC